MIQAVIIDDEQLNREALEQLLKENFPDISIAGHAANVDSGISLIEKTDPQIVFLDIQMPDGTGFDLLRKLKEYNFEVIFTTAHDEYALDAFHASAIGYLLKPIEEKELQKTVMKAIELSQSKQSTAPERIHALTGNYSIPFGKIRKIVIPDAEGFQIMAISEMVYLQGDRNYTKIVMKEGKPLLSSFNLGWFEKLLDKEGFLRISKSHIINLSYTVRYTKGEGGSVVMINGDLLPIAVNKRDELKEHFL